MSSAVILIPILLPALAVAILLFVLDWFAARRSVGYLDHLLRAKRRWIETPLRPLKRPRGPILSHSREERPLVQQDVLGELLAAKRRRGGVANTAFTKLADASRKFEQKPPAM